jgi:1-deoxy-D-xylulose-5-phosphate reductoisomerase
VRRLLILGSTGSIGTQALDILERDGDAFELVGLSAESSWEPLVEQARRFGVGRIALADATAAARAAEAWTDGEVLAGAEGSCGWSSSPAPTSCSTRSWARPASGRRSRRWGRASTSRWPTRSRSVVGGELVTALAEATGRQILPVDSEHSALHQLLAGEPPGTVAKLVLTASGGPFRGRTRDELEDVTIEQALAHPTWAMGGKITIDSATLMNKGLEVIEAHHLFGTPYDRIDVVVHPQSIVHSYVLLNDGAALAHLGFPDMRVPISYALHHPQRVDVPVRPLDLVEVGALTFEAVDTEAFPCLRLAREAAVAGGTAPCVLNAANEVAVHAFLEGRLPFLGIASVIEETLTRLPGGARLRVRDALRGRPRGRARRRATSSGRTREHVPDRVRAFAGFAILIILHEAGHFAAAKAVGMRVEKFMLFFGKPLVGFQRGETYYGIGWIPAGGFVKITGMNPHEELAPRSSTVRTSARRSGSAWSSSAAGPLVNLVLAFVILPCCSWPGASPRRPTASRSSSRARRPPRCLRPGDRIVAVDGKRGNPNVLRGGDRQAPLRRASRSDGCRAETPAEVTIVRGGRGAHARGDATLRRRAQEAAHRLQLRRQRAGRRRGRRVTPVARHDVGGDLGDRRGDRAALLQPRGPQRGRRRRRLLRDDAPGVRRRHRAGDLHPRPDLAVARRGQPVPAAAARRRPHLLGAGREAARPGDPVQRHGARQRGRLRAHPAAVRDRAWRTTSTASATTNWGSAETIR